MPKVDIWMPVYIGDYLGDTTELSAAEHGAYLLLLMHYWLKKGEIGNDVERLARVCKTDKETCSFILGYYFTLEGGAYKNKRADEEMKNAENRRQSASENGKKGGRPPKENPQETGGFSEGNPQKSSSSSSSSSSSHEERKEETGKPSSTHFQKPTLEEVEKYCLERRNGIDASRFLDYYESKGWIIGKTKMKDWQAAVRTWERSGYNTPTKPHEEYRPKSCPKCGSPMTGLSCPSCYTNFDSEGNEV